MERREIKFRVWDSSPNDRRRKKMIYFTLNDFADDQDRYGKHNIDIVTMPLMQYTGLKDRNGKEIYEGDIVGFPNESDPEAGLDPFNIEEVSFEQGCFIAGDLNLYEFYSHELEVIGNIYENPGLIKP